MSGLDIRWDLGVDTGKEPFADMLDASEGYQGCHSGCPNAHSEQQWTDCGYEYDAWCEGFISQKACENAYENYVDRDKKDCRLYQIQVMGKRHPDE